MSHKPGYSIGEYRDPAQEVERLRRQAEVVAREEEAALVALGLPERGRALDVGCGPGAVAARLRATRPDLTIVGVDNDPEVLAHVRDMETVLADAGSIPLPPASFDFAYARVVLRHLRRPESALAEMIRLVKPGGRIVVGDTDDAALLLHPEPPELAAVRRARSETWRRRGADPWIGRRLLGLLEAAGVRAVEVRPVVISSAAIGTDAFAAIILAPLADGIDEDLLPRQAVADVASRLREWAATPGAFGLTTAIIAGGERP